MRDLSALCNIHLLLLLHHPGVALRPPAMCSASRVCNSWRAAVAASGAGTTDTVIDNQLRHPQRQPAEYADTLLSKLGSFAVWLSQHAATVHSILVSCSAGNSQAAFTTACQVLAVTLRLATAGPRPLQLQRFASNIINSEVLAALPSSLTELSLSGSAPANLPWSIAGSLDAALGRMTKLQSLSLSIPEDTFGVEVRFGSLAKHTQLTRLCLQLQGMDKKAMWVSLQDVLAGMSALQDLTLNLQFADAIDDGTNHGLCRLTGGPSLSSMSALTRLELGLQPILPGPGDWLLMPPQLRELTVELSTPGWQSAEGCMLHPVVAMQLTGLQHLQRVSLRCSSRSPLTGSTGDVLKQLTRLQALNIQYTFMDMAGHDVDLWKSLPCLKGLCIIDPHAAARLTDTIPSFDSITDCLPSLCGLTSLELTVFSLPSYSFKVCDDLTQLTKLQQLRLEHVGKGIVHARDCMQLLHLRKLTSLVLRDMWNAVDNMVAVTLACNMPELCYLDITGCQLKVDTAVPAFAQLQHLTKIVLSGNSGYTDTSISLLHWQRSAAGLPKLIVEHKS